MEAQDNPQTGTLLLTKTTDTKIEHTQEFHQVNINDFKESEPNNPARLTPITRELDDLHQ